jgi:hypothetical protein
VSAFSVDPATLRASATSVDDVASGASGASDIVTPSNVGHAGLADAAAHFVRQLGDSWRARLDEVTTLASGLRSNANLYAEADDDGASRVRSGGGGTF